MAWWTCPIEAAEKGIGLNSANEECHDDPREGFITPWNPQTVSVSELVVSVMHTPFAGWACGARCLVSGGRPGRALVAGHVYLSGMSQGTLMQ